ncbi:glycerol kinase GlpK [bacterium]|jgi:glycerol kinase|nr:glycerol kinase GlpK [bacterium]
MSIILALDLGTTGNRAIAFNKKAEIVAQSYYEFEQHFPEPAWVEHDPIEIWDTAQKALKDVLDQVGVENVVSMGITNQRETTILWDKTTGKPVYNAIVWQCRRTADRCKQLEGYAPMIKEKTGLFLDAYFSASKIEWILETIPEAMNLATQDKLLFGTVDSWILWNLTKGKVHATDTSNASRTMLFNIHTMAYSSDLLQLFNISESILPQVRDSDTYFGDTDTEITGKSIPIRAILGDQQAALFAQCGSDSTQVKNTYGTGLFVMANIGKKPIESDRLITTVAWTESGKTYYALEGSVFVGGAAIQWLRDGIEILEDAAQTQSLAETLDDNEGVYFVPALTGLGAPTWDPDARGLIIGLTRGTTRAHLARAALESIAFQTQDVIAAMPNAFTTLKVDGGASANPFLMQFQADISDLIIQRPTVTESTALGVAGLAGIAASFWTHEQFRDCVELAATFEPTMSEIDRRPLMTRWHDAVSRATGWA